MSLSKTEMKRVFDKSGTKQPQPTPPVLIAPTVVGEVQLQAMGLNVGLTPDGKKVLQFIHPPLKVTVLIDDDEIKKAIVRGLTGIEVVGGS